MSLGVRLYVCGVCMGSREGVACGWVESRCGLGVGERVAGCVSRKDGRCAVYLVGVSSGSGHGKRFRSRLRLRCPVIVAIL